MPGNRAKPLGTLCLQTTSQLLVPNMLTMWTVRWVWTFLLSSLLCLWWACSWFFHLICLMIVFLQLKYKETYEKQKGHYLAGTQINDFPAVVHSLSFQKIRSAVSKSLFSVVGRGFRRIMVVECKNPMSNKTFPFNIPISSWLTGRTMKTLRRIFISQVTW